MHFLFGKMSNQFLCPFLKSGWFWCWVVWTIYISVRSVQLLSPVRLFATPWNAAHQASLSIISCWSLLKLMSIELMMPFSVVAFSSCPQSFPATWSFQVSQLYPSGGQSIGVLASTSVLLMNTQDWSPLGRTSWISLQSKGLSAY